MGVPPIAAPWVVPQFAGLMVERQSEGLMAALRFVDLMAEQPFAVVPIMVALTVRTTALVPWQQVLRLARRLVRQLLRPIVTRPLTVIRRTILRLPGRKLVSRTPAIRSSFLPEFWQHATLGKRAQHCGLGVRERRACIPEFRQQHRAARADQTVATGATHVSACRPSCGREVRHGQKDIFVHTSALDRAGIAGLMEGQRVRVDVADGRKGPEAAGIRLI